MGGVHRIRYSLHYYLNYLFTKQQPLRSVTSNLLFSVTILCTTSLTPLFLDCPCASIPVPFLSLFCLGWKVCLLACSPLSAANQLSCSKISVSNSSYLSPTVPWMEVGNEIDGWSRTTRNRGQQSLSLLYQQCLATTETRSAKIFNSAPIHTNIHEL